MLHNRRRRCRVRTCDPTDSTTPQNSCPTIVPATRPFSLSWYGCRSLQQQQKEQQQKKAAVAANAPYRNRQLDRFFRVVLVDANVCLDRGQSLEVIAGMQCRQLISLILFSGGTSSQNVEESSESTGLHCMPAGHWNLRSINKLAGVEPGYHRSFRG